MPTFIFVPRCMECREPAAVVDEGKYFCGSCFLEKTVERRTPDVIPSVARDPGGRTARHPGHQIPR